MALRHTCRACTSFALQRRRLDGQTAAPGTAGRAGDGYLDRGTGPTRAGNTETTRSSAPPGFGPQDRETPDVHSDQ